MDYRNSKLLFEHVIVLGVVVSNIHELINDKNVFFVKKLKVAVKNDLEYWSSRDCPPNSSVEEFRLFVDLLDETEKWYPNYKERISLAGKYGETGQDFVFSFEKTIIIFGESKTYYCKGYFFEKNNLRGVVIQSFRKVTLKRVK